jgi:hypothetical protein
VKEALSNEALISLTAPHPLIPVLSFMVKRKLRGIEVKLVAQAQSVELGLQNRVGGVRELNFVCSKR